MRPGFDWTIVVIQLVSMITTHSAGVWASGPSPAKSDSLPVLQVLSDRLRGSLTDTKESPISSIDLSVVQSRPPLHAGLFWTARMTACIAYFIILLQWILVKICFLISLEDDNIGKLSTVPTQRSVTCSDENQATVPDHRDEILAIWSQKFYLLCSLSEFFELL